MGKTKKDKIRNTKKAEELKQSTPLEERKAKNKKTLWSKKMCLQTIWASITAISVLLNFYLAYLTLRPKIIIDYASHLIPENPKNGTFRKSILSCFNFIISVIFSKDTG